MDSHFRSYCLSLLKKWTIRFETLLVTISILIFCCLFLEIQATISLAASQSSLEIFASQEIVVTQSGIQLKFNERALHEILQYISRMSGIQFSLSSELKAVPVTATINAIDWPTAIQQLLRSFSTTERWVQEGKQLRQVDILKHTEVQSLLSETTQSLGDDFQKPEDAYLLEPPPASSLPPVPPPPLFPPELQ